jgi:hypothetical protein
MEEVWKDIEGYEGRYQVSNLGRIKSFLHVGVRKDVEILDDCSHIIIFTMHVDIAMLDCEEMIEEKQLKYIVLWQRLLFQIQIICQK